MSIPKSSTPAAALPPAPPAAFYDPATPDVRERLARLPAADQQQALGTAVYYRVERAAKNKDQTGKITGMLLEMPRDDLLDLIESPNRMADMVSQAEVVLKDHAAQCAKEKKKDSTSKPKTSSGSGSGKDASSSKKESKKEAKAPSSGAAGAAKSS
jgi:hypothetical protein